MSGSHWVATYVKDNVINYFDSFGLPPFQEILDHAKRRNLTLLHQNQQIQNLYTTTCGYYCLYFLNEMHKNVDYFDLLQVFDTDTNRNEKFIENYFKKLLVISSPRCLQNRPQTFWQRKSITFCILCLYSSLLRLTTIASLKQHAQD